MSEWTEELKAEIIAAYEDANPTAENTTDIVVQLAEEYDKTPNGVRRILSAAGVYISKANAATTKANADKPARKSKEDSIRELTDLLEAQSVEVDEAILSKLTGKAAVYFAEVVKQLTKDD